MKHALFLVVFLLLWPPATGQLPESKEIDAIFNEWDKTGTPGGALGIIRDGEIVYAKGYGLANLEYDIPNSTSTIFRIASVSKQFTAACIVLLAERGKLDFNDTLKSFFPEFPDYSQKVLIRHLLNHTSGIRDYIQLAYLKGLGDDDYYTDDDVMRWLANQSDLSFEPGDEYLYSNSGYWLLGKIVEKISGTNLADFAQKELFEPLGMKNTHFHRDHTHIVKNRASGYAPSGNGTYKIYMTTLDMIGDGGILTTINDIKKWDDAFYNRDVLSQEFWSEMTRQGVLNNGETIDYAAGLHIEDYKGLKTIRHGGSFAGFRAHLLRFPEDKVSIGIFANRSDAGLNIKANMLADILLDEKLTAVTKVENRESQKPGMEYSMHQLVGSYKLQPGVIVTMSIKNDSLHVLQSWDKASYNLAKKEGNTFFRPGENFATATFSNLMDGFTQTLTVLQGENKMIATRLTAIDIPNLNIDEYLGSYYSKELDPTYDFNLENGSLTVRNNGRGPKMECTIDAPDQCKMDYGVVRFQRINGKVSGFQMDALRIKNLNFKRM